VLLWKRTKIKTHMAFLLAKPTPLNVNHGNDRFSMFNKKRDIADTLTQPKHNKSCHWSQVHSHIRGAIQSDAK